MPSLNNPARRRFLAGAAATALMAGLGLPQGAMALDTASARALIERAVGEVNTVIASGKSETAMYADFERIFRKYSDIPTIARYALGVEARSASAAQMAQFTEVFTGYVSRKYGKRFREFIGGQIQVEGARAVKSFYEVRCTVQLRGRTPFEVVFLVSDRSGKNLFFNLFIEGINMLLSERTEIGAMLDRRRGDLDALIQDLRKAG